VRGGRFGLVVPCPRSTIAPAVWGRGAASPISRPLANTVDKNGVLDISKIMSAATTKFLFFSPWFRAMLNSKMDAPTGLRGNERTFHADDTSLSLGKKKASTIVVNRNKPPSKVRYVLGITLSSRL
jgi:hypothetical protein